MPEDFKICSKIGFIEGIVAAKSLKNIERIVVCAALKSPNGLILGPRHYDEIMVKQYHVLKWNWNDKDIEQGFVDQYGVFMDRLEAFEVATKSEQINRYRDKTRPLTLLFSEDLY